MTRVSPPRVYSAIRAVIADLSLSGIAKRHLNDTSDYAYRGIDDIYNRLSPILARRRLCILPRMLERGQREHRGQGGQLLFSVWVRAAFDLVSVQDGSVHTIEMFGEAMDEGDKATSKAMSAAYKYAAMQIFCIPLGGESDADAQTHRPAPSGDVPDQGWEGWSTDLIAIVKSCDTHEALDRLQNMHRTRLRSLSFAEPQFYGELGEAIRARRAALPGSARKVAA
jgi:hypothetical protein